MTDFMLTADTPAGWRDIRVNGAPNIREAVRVAERELGVVVSHGRGGVVPQFKPGDVIDFDTLEVRHVHDRTAKPVVPPGPIDAGTP